MPRANRYYQPGHVWHITHRCIERQFLLKFARDRRRYLHWLFEAKKRFGLCVLNYIVTSNHVHLLVKDTGRGEIARSMQLAAARVAQEYNRRKGRKGAFWEDRYHATAVDSDSHLARCLLYIDLNMVRAGVVAHPGDWAESGFAELVSNRQRYQLLDLETLGAFLGLEAGDRVRRVRMDWVDKALEEGAGERNPEWTESLAVGSLDFVRQVQQGLGKRAAYRSIRRMDDACILGEDLGAYGES